MKKLKIILLFSIVIYVIISTVIIRYDSKYINETNFSGIVSDYIIDGNQIKIYFRDKEKLIGIYYLKTIDEKNYFLNNLKYGSYVNIIGSLSIPNNNTIPNTFNYKNYLYNKRIYRLVNIDKIDINNDNISFLYKIKNIINNRIINMNNSVYLKTFILGDKSLIDSEDYIKYQKLGITHLFAISGMHISLFVFIMMFILNKLKLNKNICYIIIILLLGFYGLLISFSASIRRSYILFVLICIKKIFNIDISTLKLLFICVCINLSIDPFIIYDIGFMYSITTTFGLLISSNIINKGNYLSRLFKISLIAYLFSLPITVNNYYEINLFTPINNLIIVPLISLIIYPLSLITFIVNNPLLNISLSIFNNINSFLYSINIFNIIIPKMNLFMIIIYYSILIISININNKFILFITILLFINNIIPRIDSSNFVYFLDVGQGDSVVMISSYKKEIIMIDTGGKVGFDKEEWKIKNSNYHLIDNTIAMLKSFGIDSINKLIITHGDYDHMGEVINLVNNFKVEKVIFNCGEFNDLEKELIKVLDKKNIKYYSCIKELDIDKNKLYFLQTKEYDNENDNSNVIYTELSGYKLLFMGDASITTEKEILDRYNLSNIAVLKVGHHGSKTSSSKEFINEINPKYSIISVGKKNRYGHPNNEVLENLKETKIYRTDIDGSIMFKINNNKLKIETCEP